MTWSKGEMLKEREPTVMMKKALILLLIFVFCLSSAYAEDNVWVEESWRQIDREVDCDEIQLKIHAKVMEVPEGTEVCRYFLDNPSYDSLIAKAMRSTGRRWAATHQTENGENLLRVTRNMNSDQSWAFILHVSCRLAVISR